MSTATGNIDQIKVIRLEQDTILEDRGNFMMYFFSQPLHILKSSKKKTNRHRRCPLSRDTEVFWLRFFTFLMKPTRGSDQPMKTCDGDCAVSE